MSKKDLKPLEQEVAKRTSKRKKKPTACLDKKRNYYSCGICGSENIAECGVIFCNSCGAEESYITERTWFGFKDSMRVKCACPTFYRGYYILTRNVKICMDCDALKGPLCPNCRRPCWSKSNRRYCKACGYRRD